MGAESKNLENNWNWISRALVNLGDNSSIHGCGYIFGGKSALPHIGRSLLMQNLIRKCLPIRFSLAFVSAIMSAQRMGLKFSKSDLLQFLQIVYNISLVFCMLSILYELLYYFILNFLALFANLYSFCATANNMQNIKLS